MPDVVGAVAERWLTIGSAPATYANSGAPPCSRVAEVARGMADERHGRALPRTFA
jgi:hypothetical protein